MELSQEQIEAFRMYLRKKGLSENTAISYVGAVRQFFNRYSEITPENLKSYQQFLLSLYRPSTVNARIYGFSKYIQFLRWQPGESFLSETSITKLHVPPIKRQQSSYLNNVISNEDYRRLKEGLRKDGNYFWYFVVHFLGSTGARVSELIQIKAEYLRLGYMDLYSKGGKMRRIYFPDVLCQEAMDWISSRGISSGFLFLTRFGKPVTPRGINSQLKVFARRYHIDPSTMYAHSFRHLYAKNFLLKFNDISLLADLLGHESIETTKIYLTRSSEEQKALLDRIVTW